MAPVIGDAAARFRDTMTTVMALPPHSGRLPVLHVDIDDAGVAAVVTPLPDEDNLAQRVAAAPLSWQRALSVVAGPSRALADLHDAGITHRDLTPASIAFRGGKAVLVDIGLAAAVGSTSTWSGPMSSALEYSPPEVIDGNPPTAASDVYGMAAVVVAAITGAGPFVDPEGPGTASALVARTLTGSPTDLREFGVPDSVADMVELALAREPNDRPSAAVLAALFGSMALAEVAATTDEPLDAERTVVRSADRIGADVPEGADQVPGGDQAEPDDATRPGGRGRRMLAALVAVVMLGGLGAGAALWAQNRPTQGPNEDVVAEEEGLADRIFGRRLAEPAVLLTPLADGDPELRTLGAWWGMADWCQAEGFDGAARCYDVAARYMAQQGAQDPRELSAESLDDEQYGEVRIGYELAARHFPTEVPAGRTGFLRQRPGHTVTCEETCVAVRDLLEAPEDGGDSADATTEASPAPTATPTPEPEVVVVPAPDPAVLEEHGGVIPTSVRQLVSGLSCGDVHSLGFDYAELVEYWERDGHSSTMDPDGNGRPCETTYGARAVEAHWGPPEPEDLPAGLRCLDLKEDGYSYTEAVRYWEATGTPSSMDGDGDARPCEDVFSDTEIETYWAGQPVEDLPSGLRCLDIKDNGFDYADSVQYWQAKGQPASMDSDEDGRPCEGVYPDADVVAFWGPEPPPPITFGTDLIIEHANPADLVVNVGVRSADGIVCAVAVDTSAESSTFLQVRVDLSSCRASWQPEDPSLVWFLHVVDGTAGGTGSVTGFDLFDEDEVRLRGAVPAQIPDGDPAGMVIDAT